MTTRKRAGFWPWFVEGLSILFLAWLLLAVVSGLGSTFFTLQPSTESASVAALTHDGSSQHHMSVYLCVDAGADTVDGTVVIDLSSKDINLHLPGIPNLTTSLGFLSKASAFAQPPGCLDNPKIRQLAQDVVGYTGGFAGEEDVISYFPGSTNPDLSPDVRAGIQAGFPVVIGASTVIHPTPLSFRWHGVHSRSYAMRYLRLEFPGGSNSRAGTYEMPTDIWVFLSRNLTPSNPPTAAVIATAVGGNTVFHIPVSTEDPAVEVEWQDDAAAQTRDFTLLGVGVLIGVIGGMIGGIAFERFRWVEPIARWIEPRSRSLWKAVIRRGPRN